MAILRVFEIAQEAGVDTNTAMRALRDLGSAISRPKQRINDDTAAALRRALRVPPVPPETAARPPTPAPMAPQRRPDRSLSGVGNAPRVPMRPLPRGLMLAERDAAIRAKSFDARRGPR